MLPDGVGPAEWGRVEGGAMNSTAPVVGITTRSRVIRLCTSLAAVTFLSVGGVSLSAASSSATSRGSSASDNGARKATFDITVAIPAGGVGYNYIRSITGAASEITVKN